VIYFCCDRRRRREVSLHPTLNGIDYLEVLDSDRPSGSPRQRTLLVRCLKSVTASGFNRGNVRIEGGERIRPVEVLWAFPAAAVPPALLADGSVTAAEAAYFAALPDNHEVLVARTNSAGDHSLYTLRLIASATETPPTDWDPRLASVDFSFKVECPSDFDCRPRHRCPAPPRREPRIDYLAKDYSSFRRRMLDRMALLAPRWRERNAADLGVALVELLAHVGDQLSYRQDAVGTEAYLGTARRRVSARRHARLVDYFPSDGSNARTWVQIAVSADIDPMPGESPAVAEGTALTTFLPDQGVTIDPDPQLLDQAEVVFETLEERRALFQAHDRLPFYTWSDERCCLVKGATAATLAGHFPDLQPGEVLLFEEVLGPHTGRPGDADPRHRHAVRLTEVTAFDGSLNPLTDPLPERRDDGTEEIRQITEIRWAEEDALPFPLCLSCVTDEEHGREPVEEVSVARGNIVLADHGRTFSAEDLGTVPRPILSLAPEPGGDPCAARERTPLYPRFRPRLREAPLTQAAPYDSTAAAAAAKAFAWTSREVLPAITALESELDGDTDLWTVRRDLLSSDDGRRDFVVEVESDGTAALRFGDDHHGLRPQAGTAFRATYRVGNGTAGNLGAEALCHIVSSRSEITAVRNPLAARGGTEPETLEDIRRRAPAAFRTQERAVTEEDYGTAATKNRRDVQKAAATFRWTGSWHTVFVTVDRLGGAAVTPEFETELRAHLEPFRMAGHDLEVDDPRFVPLEVEMQICVHPDHFRGDVRRALEETLTSGELPDGRRGVFHPDRFTFGQPVYLSRLYATAQEVPGVASVHITTFQRQDEADPKPLQDGKLPLHRLEIARLHNDPNFPEHGVLRLTLEGGK
jgi:uncharacterized phage protein gp47/JayE